MGAYSGTPDNQVQLYRCGNFKFPGCGKILTEGQKLRYGGCPHCGSRGAVSFYPRKFSQKLKAYLLILKTGELWLSRDKNTQRTDSNQAKS